MCLAIPGRILTIDGDDPVIRSGRVDFAGVVKRVHLGFRQSDAANLVAAIEEVLAPSATPP